MLISLHKLMLNSVHREFAVEIKIIATHYFSIQGIMNLMIVIEHLLSGYDNAI